MANVCRRVEYAEPFVAGRDWNQSIRAPRANNPQAARLTHRPARLSESLVTATTMKNAALYVQRANPAKAALPARRLLRSETTARTSPKDPMTGKEYTTAGMSIAGPGYSVYVSSARQMTSIASIAVFRVISNPSPVTSSAAASSGFTNHIPHAIVGKHPLHAKAGTLWPIPHLGGLRSASRVPPCRQGLVFMDRSGPGRRRSTYTPPHSSRGPLGRLNLWGGD